MFCSTAVATAQAHLHYNTNIPRITFSKSSTYVFVSWLSWFCDNCLSTKGSNRMKSRDTLVSGDFLQICSELKPVKPRMVLYTEKSSNLRKKVSFVLPESKSDNVDRLRLKSPAGDSSITHSSKSTAHFNKNFCKQTNESESRTVRPRINTKVKKSFVRHSELAVGLPSSTASAQRSGRPPTRRHPESSLGLASDNGEAQVDKEDTDKQLQDGYKSKFSAPELYSSLRIGKKIKSQSRDPVKSAGVSINLADLPTDTKQHIEEKAATRLNFPFEEQLYRDLVTLNVAEDEMFGRDGEKCVCSSDYDSSRVKETEPVLADFHAPAFSREYGSVNKPPACNVDKVRRYNGLAVYNKMQRWERND